MPQITKPSLVLALLCCLLALTLAGCGDTNSKSDYEPERGEHPEGWLPSGHAQAALGHAYTCTPCHGQNLQGGISKFSCTQCHGASIATGGTDGGVVTDVHPWGWGQFAYALHADFVRRNGTGECDNRYCHGTNLEGGEGGAGPSCSACHLGGPLSIHPTTWERRFTTGAGARVGTFLPDHGDYVNANGAARCTIQVCHGTGEPQPGDLFSTGRACRACHF